MTRPSKSRGSWIVAPIAAGAVLIAVWYAARRLWHIPSFILPAPHEILRAAWEERHTLLAAAFVTARGAVLGFLAATGLGFALATAMAFSIRLKQSLLPYVLMLQMTPVIVLAPILVLWLGQGLPSIAAITFLICFFPVVANTTMGFASVDRNLQELFALCRASRRQEILHLRIPAALPYFLTGVKIAGTLAPIGAITGDFLAGTAQNGIGGIGFMTIVYFSQLKTAAMLATGLVACVMGFGFVGAVNLLHWRLLHSWHDSYFRVAERASVSK